MEINFVLDPLTLTPHEQMVHDLAMVRAKHYLIAEIDLITSIEEVDRMRIYEKFRLNSTHAYCRDVLRLSNDVASNFIYVARKTREVSGFKEAIAAGDICMSTARKMCSVLKEENKEKWFAKGKTSTTAEIEREVARENPRAARRPHVKPVGPDRNRVAFEAPDQFLDKRRRIQDLESQRLGRAATIAEVELAMADAYLENYDPVLKADRAEKRQVVVKAKPAVDAQGKRTAPPAHVVHAVNRRDRGECQVVVNGKKCGSTRFVEQHHIIEISSGGEHTLENLITVCSAHHRQIHEDQEYTV